MSSQSDQPAGGRYPFAARLGAAAQALLGNGRRRTILGHIDEKRDGVLYGWAHMPARPDLRLRVDVFVNGAFAGQGLAHVFRRDLAEQGFGDGRCGFEFLIGAATEPEPGNIRAFAVVEDRRVELVGPSGKSETQRFGRAEDYLRATFGGSLQGRADADDLSPSRSRSGRWRRLLGPGRTGAAAYLEHVARREGFDSSDRSELLRNYLKTYGRRRGRLRAPMSAEDMDFLNAGPTDDAPLTASRAQALLGRSAELSMASVFRWAAFDSAAIGVEDCLVPPSQARMLATCEGGEAYPLSRFMQAFVVGAPLQMSTETEDGRKLIWVALLLLARRMPHVLAYAPAEWVDRLLHSEQGKRSPFEAMVSEIFGATYTAENLRTDIARAGYDLPRRSFASRTPDGARILGSAQPGRSSPVVDVQLIGPFTRRLGISDSCRTLALALQQTGRSLRLCDYTLDHPNPQRDASAFVLEQPGPARVTILHLNLEDIPAAIAYLPDVLTDTCLVAFPYLELSKPDDLHRLGLGCVDEIWAASHFIADALAPHVPTSVVGTACKPLQSVGKAAARQRAYGAEFKEVDFIFLTAGDAFSGARRKNPLGAIWAFRAAFPDDPAVRLVVKTHSRALVGATMERDAWSAVQEAAAKDTRIFLIDRMLDDPDMAALIEGADCLVSLHRAEGFGYHLLEAMALRTPVVATAYSGNIDFCTPQTAFLVDFDLAPIEQGEYTRTSPGQSWADPRLPSAVSALRNAREDAAARAARVSAAHTLVAQAFSIEAFAIRVNARLSDILTSGH